MKILLILKQVFHILKVVAKLLHILKLQFAYFETTIAYFESPFSATRRATTIPPSPSFDDSADNIVCERDVNYSVDSRIQAVTLWPVRCLKARLKVL